MMENKGLLSYDIMSIPHMMSADQLMYVAVNHDVIFWDSFNNGQAPVILKEFEKNKIIIDSSTEEGKKLLAEIYIHMKEEKEEKEEK
jgi:hypothetical protein